MWNKPDDHHNGWMNQAWGEGERYGADITEAFLEANDLTTVICAQYRIQRGYQEYHDGKVI